MIIEFMVRLLQLSGIVVGIISVMLVISIKTQDQWKIMREQALVAGWRKAIANEREWRRYRRMRGIQRYEYEPSEPPT